MLKTNFCCYSQKLALVLLCGFIVSCFFSRSGKAEPNSPTKPAAAFCACCPEHGMWEQQPRKLGEFESEGLAKLKFDQKVYLYLTAASPDDIKGVELSGTDEEGVTVRFSPSPRNWALDFKGKKGETGKLILTLPTSATFFHADVRNDPKSWAAPDSVYKEVRFEGLVQGTGIFAKGLTAHTKYRLVLQGQGGTCFDASQFYRWNLRVSGANAEYTLYGFFSKGQQ